MSEMNAGHDMDVLISEKVMGISLIPSRDAAKVEVGYKHVTATGRVFSFDNGKKIPCPPGDTLREPEGTTRKNWNDRYFLYMAEQMSPEWDAEIEAVRMKPKPYSTDLRAAWEIVEKLKCYHFDLGLFNDGWRCELCVGNNNSRHYKAYGGRREGNYWEPQYAALAICRAALTSVGL